jgi:hypothetical protein
MPPEPGAVCCYARKGSRAGQSSKDAGRGPGNHAAVPASPVIRAAKDAEPAALPCDAALIPFRVYCGTGRRGRPAAHGGM